MRVCLGTGTPVGDPVEVSAVGRVYGAGRKQLKQEPCPVGSVKTNVGHLEAAAGIAGIIKVLLMMKHETLVPSVLFGKLKQSLNLEENHVLVLGEKRAWKETKFKGEVFRSAAINAFGFGGSNIHAIVQSYNTTNHKENISISNQTISPHIVLFTGLDFQSTKESMSDTLKVIETNKDITLTDIAYTSCHRRSRFKHRVAIPVASIQELKTKLETSIRDGNETGRQKTKIENNVGFVFCGMGTHWSGMGMELYEKEFVYRQTIDELHNIFQSFGDFDLRQCIAGKYDLSDPKYGQPSIFAVQVALYKLWRSKGVCPDVIVGHSVGEVAAAYASGRLSLESAAFVIFTRGRVLAKAKDGSMMAIGKLPVKLVLDYMKPYEDKLTIAAFNSPTSCTVSGASDEMSKLQNKLESLESKPFVRRLAVKVAYHSKFMDPILNELKESLQSKPLKSNNQTVHIKHISTVTGKEVSESQIQNADYWTQNVRNSVYFTDAMALALAPEKSNVIVEIGPKPALRSNIKEIAAKMEFNLMPSISENKDPTFYQSLASAHELEIVTKSDISGRIVLVPRYAFNRQFLFKIPEPAIAWRRGLNSESSTGHPFVRKEATHEDSSCEYQCIISPQTTDFVYEHIVSDTIIVPGATYVEMGLAGLSQMTNLKLGIDDRIQITGGVNFSQVCHLKDADSKALLAVVFQQDAHNTTMFHFDVTSGETLHAAGKVNTGPRSKGKPVRLNFKTLGANHSTVIDNTLLYDTLRRYKFSYGPTLRSVREISTDYKDAIIKLEIPDSADLMNTIIHPAVLDSLLQSGVIFPSQSSDAISGQVMPYGIDEVNVYGKFRKQMLVYMVLAETSPWKLNATICGTDGVVLADCKGITYGVVGTHLNFDVEQCCFLSSWKGVDESQTNKTTDKSDGRILILHDDQCTFPVNGFLKASVKVKISGKLLENIIDNELALEKLLPHDIAQYSAIVCLLGLHRKCKSVDTYSGSQMNNLVLTTNMPLIQLAKIASKHQTFPAIYVITKGSYSLLHDQEFSPQQALNALLGVTTTAMCRTVTKELPALQLCSIDTDGTTKKDLAVINKLLTSEPGYTELTSQLWQSYVWNNDTCR